MACEDSLNIIRDLPLLISSSADTIAVLNCTEELEERCDGLSEDCEECCEEDRT